ncbi:hypothetical protein C9374_002449 [Naegleria lovaniensis]|uniref:Right handed beta helix domain-containing protein n=1 Tax=Naegleria lovaniensis TaxID=51637 RepID=A0AA88GPT4_NAELO|nr:uncharacterized protein C9374_002449 [Naegleria lovaniensis]KAG2386705.1 hypothetical protein C9374_002449 [Naegleria lovaniensis]
MAKGIYSTESDCETITLPDSLEIVVEGNSAILDCSNHVLASSLSSSKNSPKTIILRNIELKFVGFQLYGSHVICENCTFHASIEVIFSDFRLTMINSIVENVSWKSKMQKTVIGSKIVNSVFSSFSVQITSAENWLVRESILENVIFDSSFDYNPISQPNHALFSISNSTVIGSIFRVTQYSNTSSVLRVITGLLLKIEKTIFTELGETPVSVRGVSRVQVEQCSFSHNDGGGLQVDFQDVESNAEISISNSSFTSNKSPTNHGGAVHVKFADLVGILNVVFENNSALSNNGGALFLQTIAMNLYSLSFVNNSAMDGGALYLSRWSSNDKITTYWSNYYFERLTFQNNLAQSRGGAIFFDLPIHDHPLVRRSNL